MNILTHSEIINIKSRFCANPQFVVRSYQQFTQRYATELLTRLLDMGFMRQIGLAKRRMAQLPDGEEKITLLGQITRMETARKDLQAQIYGNTVG